MTLRADVRRKGSLAVLDLHGDIDGGAEGTLNAAVTGSMADGTSSVVLNFADVTYINSTGIALIVGVLRQTREHDHRLVATGLSQHYREIFDITRLSDLIEVVDSEDDVTEGG